MDTPVIFQTLLDSADTAIENYVFGTWVQFNAIANGWVTSLMIISIAVIGYLILVGKLEVSLPSLFPEFLKIFAIYIVVINAGLLTTLIYNLFTEIPEAVGNFLISNAGGASSININGAVDEVWVSGMDSSTQIFSKHGWRGWLIGASLWIVTILYVGFVTFILMLSKLAVSVLLALAPFFLLLYLFTSTKPFFEGWLRQTATFALVPVLLYALLGLMLSILGDMASLMSAAANEDNLSLGLIAPFIIMLLVATLINTQILSWAAGICGGFALATQGAFGRTTKGAGRATAATGRGSYTHGKTLYHHLKNRRRTP